MANLILNNHKDISNATKRIHDVINWRAVGQMANNELYLITFDCNILHIRDLSLEQFHEMNFMGLDLSKEGVFNEISLTCPHCIGKGITDWITQATGHSRNKFNDDIVFERDKTLSALKLPLYIGQETIDIFFARSIIPEAHEHCKECNGTGLYMYDELDQKPTEVKIERW